MTQEQYNRYMDGLILKVASKKLNKTASFRKRATTKRLSNEEIRNFIDPDSTAQDLSDILFNNLQNDRRAGFAAGLAEAQGKDVPFVLSNPETTNAIGGFGGAGLGGLVGYGIGKSITGDTGKGLIGNVGGISGAALGTGLGALFGVLLSKYLTRRAAKNAVQNYLDDPSKGDANNIDTSRTGEGRFFNVYGNPWYRGRAAAKAKLLSDKREADELMGSPALGYAPVVGSVVGGPIGGTIGNAIYSTRSWADGYAAPEGLAL